MLRQRIDNTESESDLELPYIEEITSDQKDSESEEEDELPDIEELVEPFSGPSQPSVSWEKRF
jgi:hypothetical protein